MKPYHKIETLFVRDSAHKVTEELKNPLYGSFNLWHVTEKIDGTNIRIMLSKDGKVTFGGKTDNASLPSRLVTYLNDTFTEEKMKNLWKGEPCDICLYGEGYGAGIQKGGDYNQDQKFRLFDVLVGDKWWLGWEDVTEIAEKIGIKTVPFLGLWTLPEIINKVNLGVPSIVAKEESGKDIIAEGVVGRTMEPLFDKHGKRVILKLKTKDFGAPVEHR